MWKLLILSFLATTLCSATDSESDVCGGENESWNDCPPACSSDSCGFKPRKDIACAQVCRPGCWCNPGYCRDSNKVCVPIKECSGNAIWNTCPPQKCDAEFCPKSRDDPPACRSTKNCGEPRCTCGFNQKRDRKTKNCIAIRDCPPFACDGPNEQYVACPPVCPGETCQDFINNSTCPKYRIGIVVPCQPQCKCKKNYYRNSKNICVKSSQCLKDEPVTTGPPSTPAPSTGGTALEKLKRGINIFNFKFLPQIIASKPGENVICSGLSAQLPFAQLARNANGVSKDELLTALNLSNKDEIDEAYKPFLESWKSGNGVTFAKVLNIYANKDYPLNNTFITTNKDIFNASNKNIDCSTPKVTADEINSWVAANTNNLIQNLIPESVIDPSVRLLLVNALYFQGTWNLKFDKNNTKDRDFHPDNKTTIQVPTMYIEAKFNYTNDAALKAQIVDLYFENTDYKFRIVLPNTIDGLSETISNLNDDSIQKAEASMTAQKCKLWLPKFKITSSFELTDVLKAVGIKAIFDVKTANLTGILKDDLPIFVSAVLQKAFVEIKEEGAEAAAATGVVVGVTSVQYPPPEIPKINCDHPFLFFIYYGGQAMFAGKYENNK